MMQKKILRPERLQQVRHDLGEVGCLVCDVLKDEELLRVDVAPAHEIGIDVHQATGPYSQARHEQNAPLERQIVQMNVFQVTTPSGMRLSRRGKRRCMAQRGRRLTSSSR
jgi:hypothetical protein